MVFNNAQVFYRSLDIQESTSNKYIELKSSISSDDAMYSPVHIDTSKIFDASDDYCMLMLKANGINSKDISGELLSEKASKLMRLLNYVGMKNSEGIISIFNENDIKEAKPADKLIDRQVFSEGIIKAISNMGAEFVVDITRLNLKTILKTDDGKVIGYLSADREDDTTEYAICSVVADKGFGYVMYALSAMALNGVDCGLSASYKGNTNDDAKRVWGKFKSRGFDAPLNLSPGEIYQSLSRCRNACDDDLFREGLDKFVEKYNSCDDSYEI